MSMRGAELLIYPTAIGWDPHDEEEEKDRQQEAWITIQRSHAVANGLPVVSVNRVGFEADPTDNSKGIRFWGTSFMSGPQGEILAMADRHAEQNLIAKVDIGRSEDVRRIWPFFRDRRIDHYQDLTKRFLD